MRIRINLILITTYVCECESFTCGGSDPFWFWCAAYPNNDPLIFLKNFHLYILHTIVHLYITSQHNSHNRNPRTTTHGISYTIYTTMIPHHSTHAAQLLDYLEQGVSPSECARALGITPSAVTQLMESPELSDKIAAIRQAQLNRSAALDLTYDRVESKLLDQFEKVVPMLLKPEQIISALEKVNRMKRRGISLTTEKPSTQIVHLHLPTQVRAKFTTNVSNQVVSVSGQELITIQSANVAKLAEANHANSHPQLVTTIEQETLDEFGFVTKG